MFLRIVWELNNMPKEKKVQVKAKEISKIGVNNLFLWSESQITSKEWFDKKKIGCRMQKEVG